MPFTFIFDPSKEGLSKVLKDYEELALRYIWYECEDGAVSREVLTYVNKELKKLDIKRTVSRASVINFLNYMVDGDILTYTDETCKGGHRRRYWTNMDEDGFITYIAKTVIDSLVHDFPEATMEVAKELDLI